MCALYMHKIQGNLFVIITKFMNEFCGKLVNSIYTELISGTGFVYCYVIVMSNAYLIILTYYHNMT